MTTTTARALYEAQHNHTHSHLPVAVFNPRNKPFEKLPVIYGFNNGRRGSFLNAVLVAADGTHLGGHLCSSESYMPSDLGVLDGTRPDRHEVFRQHYPNGYRMEFIGAADVLTHPGLTEAVRLNNQTP